MKKQKQIKLRLILLTVATALALFSTTGFAFASWGDTFLGFIQEMVALPLTVTLGSVFTALGLVLSAITTLTASLVETSLGAVTEREVLFDPSVQAVWGVVLGVANLFFLLALIFSSIALIMRTTGYNLKKVIGGILMAVIWANLSYIIAILIIQLARSLTQGAGELLAVGGSSGSLLVTLPFTLTKELSTAWVKGAFSLNFVKSFYAALLNLAAQIVFLIVILKLALVFIERFVRLIILIVIAPVVYALSLFPNMNRYMGEWWQNFMSWVLVLPFAYLMIALAGAFTKNIDLDFARDLPSLADQAAFFIKIIIVLAILWGASEVPKMLKLGVAVTWTGIGKTIGKTALGIGSWVAGGGAWLAGRGAGMKAAGERLGGKAGEALAERGKRLKRFGERIQRVGAIPSAISEITGGFKARRERQVEEGAREFLAGLEKVPFLGPAARLARKEKISQLASAIADEPHATEDFRASIEKQAEERNADVLVALWQSRGRRLGKGGVSRDEKKKIREDTAQLRREWDEKILTARNKQAKRETLSPEDKTALFIEEVLGSAYTDKPYVGKMQKDINYGRPFSTDILILSEQRGDYRPLFQERGALESAVKERDEAKQQLESWGIQKLIDPSRDRTEQIKNIRNIFNLYTQLLQQLKLPDTQSQEILKNPQGSKLIEALSAETPGGQKLRELLKDTDFIKFLSSLDKDRIRELTQASPEQRTSLLLSRGTLGEAEVGKYSAGIGELKEQGFDPSLATVPHTAELATSLSLEEVTPKIRVELKNAAETYNQLTPQPVEKVEGVINWTEDNKPSLGPIRESLERMVETTERINTYHTTYKKAIDAFSERAKPLLDSLQEGQIQQAIDEIQGQIQREKPVVDEEYEKSLHKIARILGLSRANVEQFGRDAETLLGRFLTLLEAYQNYQKTKEKT